MSLWIWIGLPLLLLVGLFFNAIKDMKRLEKDLPKYQDKIRLVEDDDDDHWLNRPTAPCQPAKKKAPSTSESDSEH